MLYILHSYYVVQFLLNNFPTKIDISHVFFRSKNIYSIFSDIFFSLQIFITYPPDSLHLLEHAPIVDLLFQDIGDDKIQLVQSMSDIIENKTRQLELDAQNLDFGKDEEEEDTIKPVKEEKTEKSAKRKKVKDEDKSEEQPTASSKNSTPGGKKAKKSASAQNTTPASTNTASTKKRGAARRGAEQRERSASPPSELANIEIDPDEPTYCLCDQVSYGEMIGCDNDLCPIEWFHFNCVQLTGKPKGKWFCPKCRGDKPTVMKPKPQFLKELEKFNKEKEDKLK